MKRKAKNKGKVRERGKKKNKADGSRQLWSISIFNVDDSFCPRNWKFGLRPRYVGRALIDEAWSDRRSEGRPFVRGPRSLFRQVRGTGEWGWRGEGRKKRRSLTRWLPMKSRNRLRGSTLTGTKKKKNIGRSRKKWRWKRSVWLLSNLYYLFCSIRFVVFSIFFFFF